MLCKLLILLAITAKIKPNDITFDILAKYNLFDRLARPTQNVSEPTVIYLGVDLQHILNLRWTDDRLVWDPANYSGVTDVRFPYGELWSPDVLLHNRGRAQLPISGRGKPLARLPTIKIFSADDRFDAAYPSNLVVYNDGTVNWIPPAILKASCKLDITWFPIDEQSCFFKFGSWSYHGYTLDLQAEDPEKGMATAEYIENGEWILLSTPVVRTERTYDCCREPYPDLKFYLNIRRRTKFYVFNLMIPSLLMSFMTILGFTMPPDACEKIELEITILLTVYVFLTMVADMSPPTSEAIPLIGVFFCCMLMLVSASVLFSVIVLNLHFRKSTTHEMTPFVQNILVKWLPWILRMKRPEAVVDEEGTAGHLRNTDQSLSLDEHEPGELVRQMMESEGSSMEVLDRVDDFVKKYLKNPNNHGSSFHAMTASLQQVYGDLKTVTGRMTEEDSGIKLESDWKFAAIVVDRFCLIVFSFLTMSTAAILFIAPHVALRLL